MGQPLRILFVLAFYNVEESLLNIGRHRTATAGTDLTVIHFANRRQLGGGPGKKRFIRYVKLVAGKALFDHFVALVAGDDQNGIPGDPGEDRRKRCCF